MAKIDNVDLSNITDQKEFFRWCSKFCSNVFNIVNGKLQFDQNILSQTVVVEFTTPDTDVQVFHDMGKVVSTYIPISKDAACDVYTGDGDPTSNYLFLKGTVATTVTVVLL